MLNCLKLVRWAVKALCNHDADLETSDGLFKFLLVIYKNGILLCTV
jgi:hypothetical protein